MRTRTLATALIGLAAVLVTATPASASTATTLVSGVAEPYVPGAVAVTYDQTLVPAGARLSVLATGTTPLGTTVVLTTHGLVPDREYGAHVHTKPCGAAPADAGPHFQNVADPVQPSVDPAYANPRNEVWLDFTTDATGTGVAVATVPWAFGGRPASSVVVHETHTHTDPGHAGTAGARLACLNAAF
jgi:superoxide dismutase, Cu-Zn family